MAHGPSSSLRRVVAGIAVLAAVALGASCSPGADAAAVTRSLESAPRPAAPELPPGGEPAPELPEVPLPEVPLPDPGTDDLELCVDLTSAYSEVVVLAFSGDDEGKLPDLFAQLEAAAPEDVQDDLAVVREQVIEATEEGIFGATGTLLGDEFTEANSVVVEWLAELCSGGG